MLGSLWPVSIPARLATCAPFTSSTFAVESSQAAARTVALGMMQDARYRHPFYWAAFRRSQSLMKVISK